ncbi:hypothetical protein AHAS_Ahas06G0182600 [Arachis hypogaea]
MPDLFFKGSAKCPTSSQRARPTRQRSPKQAQNEGTRPNLKAAKAQKDKGGTPHPPVTKDQQRSQSNKSGTTAPAVSHQPDTLAPTSTEDLVRDRPPVLGNPRNIGAVAGEPGSHPITMADDHDNNHASDLEDRAPHKNADTTLKDTPEFNGDKNSSNPGVIEALQNRLE